MTRCYNQKGFPAPPLFLCIAIWRVFAVSKQETSKQGDKEVNSFWACLRGGESDMKGGPFASNWKEKRKMRAVPTSWVLSSGREEHEFITHKTCQILHSHLTARGWEVGTPKKGLRSATHDMGLVGVECRGKAEEQWFWGREGITQKEGRRMIRMCQHPWTHKEGPR